jgi:hypothetical protein
MARKHIRAWPCRNVVPTESHSDGENVGYFPRTLWTVLLTLGYSEPLLLIGTLRLLRGNSYLWHVRVVIYERPTTDRIHRIRQVVEVLLAVIKYTYLPATYTNFIQDIEDRCLLLTSSTSFVDLPFQEHRMTKKHHMDQNPCISSIYPK